MSKVKAFSIVGLKLWFPSNDHEPPHFHAKRSGEWEFRVFFLLNDQAMFDAKWLKTAKTRMSKQDRQAIADMVNAHRDVLLQEWEELHP